MDTANYITRYRNQHIYYGVFLITLCRPFHLLAKQSG